MKNEKAVFSAFILHPSSLFLHPHALEDGHISAVGLNAMDVAARERRIYVVINWNNGHFGIKQILSLREQRDALHLIRFLGRLETQLIELLVLPVRIVLKAL